MIHAARLLFVLIGAFAGGVAHAHTGLHVGQGFLDGLTHPFVGLDHLLAMVAVGVWAVQMGGRFLVGVPATFVTAMAAGAVFGATGIPMPVVESGLAVSVLALGALVALTPRAAWWWAVALVGAFGLMHGHAHGAEMPAFAAPWQYFTGFTVATASLHALGVGGSVLLKRHAGVLRAGGAAIGLAGIWLLAAI